MNLYNTVMVLVVELTHVLLKYSMTTSVLSGVHKEEGVYKLRICKGNIEVRRRSSPENCHIWQFLSFRVACTSHSGSCTGHIMHNDRPRVTYHINIYLHSQSVYVSTNRWVHMLKG